MSRAREEDDSDSDDGKGSVTKEEEAKIKTSLEVGSVPLQYNRKVRNIRGMNFSRSSLLLLVRGYAFLEERVIIWGCATSSELETDC